MILAGSFFLGLNADFDRRRVTFENNFFTKNDYYETNVIDPTLKNKFYLDNYNITDNKENIVKKIDKIAKLDNNWNNLGTPKISSEIIINSLRIINFLSPSILYYLDSENIYPTKFGTIIMDWEFNNNNILSLEIAKKSIGYFMEKNGEDYKEVVEISIDNLKLIIKSLNNDISDLL